MREDIDAPEPAFHRVIGTPGSDLHGFVAIDSFVSGHGTGGVRCTETVTLEEVSRLAQEMTLKFAFLRLPSGGAKAGVVAPPDLPREERQRLFRTFGEAIGDLIREGKYVGGLDMGTTVEDIDAIAEGAGVPIKHDATDSGIDSNYFTALTVFASLLALLDARQRRLDQAAVLVEGAGKVGMHLLRLLDDAGARVVGVSTIEGAIYDAAGLDVDQLLQAREQRGDHFVTDFPEGQRLPADELFLQDADVLIPGGGADSLNDDNIGGIRARSIVAVANICATQSIEAALYERGIDFVPGFVANSGGVFCWYLGRLSDTAREEIIRDLFRARIGRLIRAADRSGRSIPDEARDIAGRNLAMMQRLDNGDVAANLLAFVRKLSPLRLGYAVGTKLLGRRWASHSNLLVRSYYDARYFS